MRLNKYHIRYPIHAKGIQNTNNAGIKLPSNIEKMAHMNKNNNTNLIIVQTNSKTKPHTSNASFIAHAISSQNIIRANI